VTGSSVPARDVGPACHTRPVPDDDDLERRVRKLVVEHAETRWLTLRLDNDVKETRQELREIRTVQDKQTAVLEGQNGVLAGNSAVLAAQSVVLDEHSAVLADHSDVLVEHTARFDSLDAQMRSLTHLVGQVLDRLPENDPGT